MQELRPGTFTKILSRVEKSGQVRTRAALGEIARTMERRAKENLAKASHEYGTRTPAVSGGPPALISGTLRRSVTHEPIRWVGAGWQTRVGTGVGFFPPYGAGRTQSAKYGYYLETGLRNGAKYPWLAPAFRLVMTTDARRIWRKHYSIGRW